MNTKDEIQVIYREIGTGIGLTKCQKCGCLRETLDHLAAALPALDANEAKSLAQDVQAWSKKMQPVQYACLGCAHCYPAVAQNAFSATFPALNQVPLACDFQASAVSWPPIVGEYFVLDQAAPVAVSTLGSIALAEELASRKPQGLAIVGKTETENIGIDKIVKNIITNPSLQYLVVAGNDPTGHSSGRTLLALEQNGVDADGRVVGSPAKRPILRNVSVSEIEAFRQQVEVIDLIGCANAEEIVARIEALLPKEPVPSG